MVVNKPYAKLLFSCFGAKWSLLEFIRLLTSRYDLWEPIFLHDFKRQLSFVAGVKLDVS